VARDDRPYVGTNFSGVPGVDASKYGHQNLAGYITLPVGDLNFMTQDNINGAPIHNPYKQYNYAHPTINYFHDPTFIDPSLIGSALLKYTSNNPILGHLVVPVFKDGEREKWYNTYDQNDQLKTPPELSSTQLFNQAIFVPKGV